METDDDVRRAEVHRLEAERRKLDLEAREIERRLSTPWWQGQRLSQYLVAIIVTAALLFGWTRVYLEPILRKQNEINALAERRNATLNELLDAQYRQLLDEQQKVTTERDRLKGEAELLRTETGRLVAERDVLEKDRRSLEAQRQVLRSVVNGLNAAVDQVARGKTKFFSILNRDDPIKILKNAHGWEMWSDNYFGSLGYYLIIRHPDVRSGKEMIVGRSIEIDKMKRESPDTWRQSIEEMITKNDGGPILALDYSYFALLDDADALVGGTLYRQGGDDIEFYAPLSQWAQDLAALFPSE